VPFSGREIATSPDTQRPRVTTTPILEPVRAVVRAVATSVVPESAAFTDGDWAEFDGIIEAALTGRVEAVRKQLILFLRGIEALPIARYATRFSRLDQERRLVVLTRLQDSRLASVRRGFWGLRTLILLGCYGRATAAAEVGYRAAAGGWAERRKPNEAKLHR